MAANRYKPVPSGFRQIARSPALARIAEKTAARIAGNANAVGDSKYESEPTTVVSGWANEKRAGAVVRETDPHWRDWRDAVLVRVTAAMKVRKR